jgi:hypothetical protein
MEGVIGGQSPPPKIEIKIIIIVERIKTNYYNLQMKKFFTQTKPEDPFDCKVTVGENDRCDPTMIQTGSLMYRPARLVVLDAKDLCLRNQDLHEAGEDADITVGQNLVRKQCWTADQYTHTRQVTLKEMHKLITREIGDCICKVVFNKLPNASDMATLLQEGSQQIEDLETADAEKHKLYKKLFERVQKGDIRIMRGYVLKIDAATGLVRFLDADLEENGERAFYMKNVLELTLRLTKYVLVK